MRVEEVLKESCVIADIRETTKQGALAELVGALKQAGLIEDAGAVLRVILDREKLGSTGIGDGIAIPHGKLKGLETILCAFGRSERGVDFDSVDGKPVHIFFLLLAPEESASLHLKMLSRISKILRDPLFRKRLVGLTDTHAIYENILDEDRKFS
jgi:nitrogen PTS system EIIA component